MVSATSALAAGNYASARDAALGAQALLSITPDTSESTDGGGSRGMTWDRVALSQFIDRMQKLLTGSTGVIVSKVVIQPVCGSGPQQLGTW